MNYKISSLLRCCTFLLVLVALLFSIRPGHAQEVTARLAGTVNDTAGALVPDAALSARNVSTGVVTTATSDPSGNYVFPSLAPGTYTLSVEKQGFATRVITGITLQVDQKATVDLMLNVGQVNQTVTVEATAPLVNSTTASMGTVVAEQAIRDLPLNLRRTGALALIVPGTVDTTGMSLTSANGNGSGFKLICVLTKPYPIRTGCLADTYSATPIKCSREILIPSTMINISGATTWWLVGRTFSARV